MRAKERTDERVAQYFSSWLIWPTVHLMSHYVPFRPLILAIPISQFHPLYDNDNGKEGKIKGKNQKERERKGKKDRKGSQSTFVHSSLVLAPCALWSKITRNPDVSTEPLARPFTYWLALLTHSLALHSLLRWRAQMRSFVCSHSHSLPSSWESE